MAYLCGLNEASSIQQNRGSWHLAWVLKAANTTEGRLSHLQPLHPESQWEARHNNAQVPSILVGSALQVQSVSSEPCKNCLCFGRWNRERMFIEVMKAVNASWDQPVVKNSLKLVLQALSLVWMAKHGVKHSWWIGEALQWIWGWYKFQQSSCKCSRWARKASWKVCLLQVTINHQAVHPGVGICCAANHPFVSLQNSLGKPPNGGGQKKNEGWDWSQGMMSAENQQSKQIQPLCKFSRQNLAEI